MAIPIPPPGRRIQTKIGFRTAVWSPIGQVSSAGFIKDGPGVPPHALRVFGTYALMYLLDGSGYYRDEAGRLEKLRPGDLVTVFPDVGHIYGPGPGERWTEMFVVFEGPAFDLFRASGVLDPERPIARLEPIEQWLGRLAPFIDGPFPATTDESAQEVCRLLAILADVRAIGPEREPVSAEQRWVAEASRVLGAELGEEIDLAQIAEVVGTPYETFRKQFQKLTGVSPARYRAQRRMEAARELLLYSRMTGKQVAEMLGFNDEYHFSKRFKQLTGKSPREFRKG
jgi:AraC-like DNA-binding protein